jgi:hypothetical protein
MKNQRCIENCKKNPCFNLPSESKALYCFEHKKENMIDVKNKKCIFKDCQKQPAFNLAFIISGATCEGLALL